MDVGEVMALMRKLAKALHLIGGKAAPMPAISPAPCRMAAGRWGEGVAADYALCEHIAPQRNRQIRAVEDVSCSIFGDFGDKKTYAC